MKRLILPLLLIILLPLAFGEIVIINETEKEFYAVDNIRLTGDLNEDQLRLDGSGEVIEGKNTKVYLFGPSKDILIKNLFVNGEKTTVSFDKKGYFFIADEGQFSFFADMMIRSLGQLKLDVPGPVNELNVNISHGYAVDGDRYGLYEDTIVIQRSEKVARTVDGAFRYSYAERNSFYYRLDLRSFGSSLGRYEMDLPNGEKVSQVTGALSWEQIGNRLVMELDESRATVVIQGYFDTATIRTPLKEEKHHVLIESDPEKKLTISTSAQELDVSEAPLPSQYSNSRVFLASYYEPINVDVKPLDLMPSAAAAVENLNTRIAITPEGGVLGEASYNYANTGVDYISADIPGTPLYAATRSGPVKLTKDEEFLLAFPKTNRGKLDLVYYDSVDPLGIISFIDVPVVNMKLPISEARTSIYLPNDQYVMGIFGAEGDSELPGFKSIMLFVIIMGIIGYFLFRNKLAFLYVFFTGGMFFFDIRLFMLIAAASIVILIKKNFKMKWKWPLIIGGGIAVGILIIGAVLMFLGSMLGSATTESFDMANSKSVQYAQEAPMMDGMERVGGGEAEMSVPTRTGVMPVPLEVPRMGKTLTLTNYLVKEQKPLDIQILLVASWVKYIFFLLALGAGYYCWKQW
ncbi:MAG: hypothetical protein R6V53_01750 [Candidatus Woesearchaeota archaeon]